MRAIEYAAMHYLVKPIEADKLKAALARYQTWHDVARDNETRFSVLLHNRGRRVEEQSLVLDRMESKTHLSQMDETSISVAKQYPPSNLKVNNGSLFVPDREKVNVVRLDQIVHLLAVGSYSMIFCANGLQFVVARTLARLDELLTGEGMPFFRAHESHIVGRAYIKNYKLGDDSEIEITHAKDKIPLARRRKMAFEEWITGGY